MTEVKQDIAIVINRKKLLAIGMLAIAILMIVGGFLLISGLHSQKSDSKKQFSELQKELDFPLYYPNELPPGYTLKPKTLQKQGEIVNFSVDYDTGKLIVTEQPLPALMEDVKKLEEFDTKAGKAYIADLEGAIAGFIKTEKTLIIISGVTGAQTEQLRDFMNALVAL